MVATPLPCTPVRRSGRLQRAISDGGTPDRVVAAGSPLRRGGGRGHASRTPPPRSKRTGASLSIFKEWDDNQEIPEESKIWIDLKMRAWKGQFPSKPVVSFKFDDVKGGEVAARNQVISSLWKHSADLKQKSTAQCAMEPPLQVMKGKKQQPNIELVSAPTPCRSRVGSVRARDLRGCQVEEPTKISPGDGELRRSARSKLSAEMESNGSYNQRSMERVVQDRRVTSQAALHISKRFSPSLNLSGNWMFDDNDGHEFHYKWNHIPGNTEFDGVHVGSTGEIPISGWIQPASGNIGWEFENGTEVVCKGVLTPDGTSIVNGRIFGSGTEIGSFTGKKGQEFVQPCAASRQVASTSPAPRLPPTHSFKRQQQEANTRPPPATRRCTRGRRNMRSESEDANTSDESDYSPLPHLPMPGVGLGTQPSKSAPSRAVPRRKAAQAPAKQGLPACLASDAALPQTSLVIGPLPSEIHTELCMARVWNSGRGGQCTKRSSQGSDLCAIHGHKHTHGRVDEAVPAQKLLEFQKAWRQAQNSSSGASARGGAGQTRKVGRARRVPGLVGSEPRNLAAPVKPLEDVEWFSEEEDDDMNLQSSSSVSVKHFYRRVAFRVPPSCFPGANVTAANEALEEVLFSSGNVCKSSEASSVPAPLHIELRIGDFVRAHSASGAGNMSAHIGEVCQLFLDRLGVQWARWRRFLPATSVIKDVLASGQGNSCLSSEIIDDRELIETSDVEELPLSALCGGHVNVVGVVSRNDMDAILSSQEFSGDVGLPAFFCHRALCGDGSGLLWEVAFDDRSRQERRHVALSATSSELADDKDLVAPKAENDSQSSERVGDLRASGASAENSFSKCAPAPIVDAVLSDAAMLRQAAAALRPCAFRGRLPGREAEQADIGDFITDAVRAGGRSQVLYVSGMPGTGKTASVLKVVQRLQSLQSIDHGRTCAPFIFAHVNAMCLSTPGAVFGEILRKVPTLCAQHGVQHRPSSSETQAYSTLNDLFARSRDPGRETVVLLLDEIDCLVTKAQTVLYRLFDWLARPDSRLVVVAIANTMDLPERLLPRVASRLGVLRVNFAPYNRAQIHAILRDRLSAGEATEAFADNALALCAARVSAASGDVRKALQVCRRAVEERSVVLVGEGDGADGDKEDLQAGGKLIGMKEIIAAEAALLRANPAVEAIARLGLKARRFLIAIVLELRRQNGSETLPVRSVVQRYEAIMRTHQNDSLPVADAEIGESEPLQRHEDDAIFTMHRLVTISLLRVHDGSRFQIAPTGDSAYNGVRLELGDSIDADDVADALVRTAKDTVAQDLLGGSSW